MQLEHACRLIGFGSDEEEILRPHWQEALDTLPSEIEFLSSPFISRYVSYLGASPSVESELQEAAQVIRGDSALRVYSWLIYHAHFVSFRHGRLGQLPPVHGALGDRGGTVSLLAALASLPLAGATLRRLGIPEERGLEGIGNWVLGTMGLYAAANEGRLGQHLQQLYWMQLYIQGRLFRIGRFEYLIHPVRDWVPALYRRRSTGAVLALCRDDWMLDVQGRAAQSGQEVFTARLENRDGKIYGTPITPDGRGLAAEPVVLDEAEWEAVLSPWDWVPSIHIPAGGGMREDLVLASLREAKVFFRRHFHRDVKAFCCMSWILNPVWETELPASNLTKFMKLLYLSTGSAPTHDTGLFFAFGRSTRGDWSHYPADTSLRRAFHHVRETGQPLRCGSGIVLTEDLDRLTANYYRDRAVNLAELRQGN